jgi:integrase
MNAPANSTLKTTLDRYILMRDVRPASERQMRSIVLVLLNWLKIEDMPIDQFTGEVISQFLADKQKQGRSSHYRRSLRNALKALHRFSRDYTNCDAIRPVKLDPLDPETWTEAEVVKLIEACDDLSYRDRNYFRTFLQVAYYTGLNAVDIHRLEKSNIDERGFIPFDRSKTHKRVFVSIPPELAAEILKIAPETGPIWPLKTSQEAFRMRFNRLVRLAGIRPGTFKQLRKTSGTLVEVANPGQGHRHLGNEPEIFAKHYEDRRVTQANPTMPPLLKLS